MVTAALMAVVGTALGTLDGSSVKWSLDGNLVFNGFVLSNLIGIFVGFAIAMLLMNTAAAIVTYFVYSLILPNVVGILGFLSEGFQDVAPWIELNTAQMPLFTGRLQADRRGVGPDRGRRHDLAADPAGAGHPAAGAARVQVAARPAGPSPGSPRVGP